jgi:lysophospholipase L1-like esterase
MSVANIKTYLGPLTDELRKEWPANRIVHVVFHGHSVPAGYFKTPVVDTFHAYPHLVHVGIKAAYPHAVVNATVTAIGGENSLSGANRFERDVLSLRPDVVVIDYALNDRGVGLDKALAAWTSMILACRQKNIKVILCTPTGDTSTRRNDPNDALVKHTEQIRRMADQLEVGLADIFSAWSEAIVKVGEPVLHSQGNHPSFEGHKVAASVITPWFTTPAKGR